MSHRRTFHRLADENGWVIDSDTREDVFRRDGMTITVEFSRDRQSYHAIFYPASDGQPLAAGFGFTMEFGKVTEIMDLLTLPCR